MKLGFVSATLAGLELQEALDFATSNDFERSEVMPWPPGYAERRYAGVTRISATFLRQHLGQLIA